MLENTGPVGNDLIGIKLPDQNVLDFHPLRFQSASGLRQDPGQDSGQDSVLNSNFFFGQDHSKCNDSLDGTAVSHCSHVFKLVVSIIYIQATYESGTDHVTQTHCVLCTLGWKATVVCSVNVSPQCGSFSIAAQQYHWGLLQMSFSCKTPMYKSIVL